MTSLPLEPEKTLDEETERLLRDVINAGLTHGDYTKLPLQKCEHCQKPLNALRSRIRTLIEEARLSSGFTQSDVQMLDGQIDDLDREWGGRGAARDLRDLRDRIQSRIPKAHPRV